MPAALQRFTTNGGSPAGGKGGSRPPFPTSRLDLPPEESTDLEELEQFAKMFKQKRIKLGKLASVMIGFE